MDSVCAVFEVTGGHLGRLDPGGAVRLVRKLVWADATASGIPANLINIPSAIHDADGGIDGEVAGAPFDSKCGIIKAGNTRYQVKSGRFSPSGSCIGGILFQKDTKNLKPRIKSCLDKNGTLVIVLTGWDGPDRDDDSVKNKFLGMLGEVNQKYKNAKIEVWRQNTIIGFLQDFPSIALAILNIDDAPILTHDDWSKLDDMSLPLYLGGEHKKYINDLREELRSNDQPIHIRVVGEPGIGKTRLILESTRTDDLAPLIVYAEDPEKLKGGNFLSKISRWDYNPFMVLVVDECDSVRRADLWNRLKGKSPGIKLVTIFNETDPSDGRTLYRSPQLGDEQIGRILGEYGVPGDQRPKWVEFCRPSPRAAHIIGQNLSENPDDILRSPDTVPVWDRYIASRIRLGSDEFRERKNVLLWLSLFKKFGRERSYAHEMKIIKNHIEKNHGIHPGDVNRTIKKLKEMKILQGGTPFYITPKILHVKLWTEWWETVGSPDMLDLAELTTSPGAGRATQFLDLLERYCEMFEYAGESPRTGKVIEEYLRPGGPFEERDLLAAGPGAELLAVFAKIDPKSVIDFLKRFLGTKGKDELIKFKRGRRQVVFALETASKRSDLFADSARLLLALGEAENEGSSNNASGVFAGLFSPESGSLAPAETPSLRRLPVIREALESGSKKRRLLAIRACNAALRASGHGGVAAWGYGETGDDFRLRRPASPGEIAGYRRDVLGILESSMGALDADQRQEAASVILDNAITLIAASGVSEVVVRVLRNLHAKYGVDSELVAAKTIEILDSWGDTLPEDLAGRLGALRDDMAGSDYHSLMRRYVGAASGIDHASGSLDDACSAEIKGLAKRSLDAGLLRGELEWLPTGSAKNGSRFGYELGKADGGFRLLPVILDAQRSADGNASGFFLGGYFAALREQDPAEWESQLDLMSDDPALRRFVAEVTWRSGMTDRAGRRIISLIRGRPDLGFRDLDCFRYGRAARKLSGTVFLEWIEFLKSENEYDSLSLALDLFYHYFVHGTPRRLPEDLTPCLLFHQRLVKKPPGAYLDGILPHRWREICLQFVRQYPDRGTAVGEKILENFASGTLFDQHSSRVWDVLDEIAGKNPALARKIASYLETARPETLLIKQWFRRWWRAAPESAGGIPIPILDEMFGWVDGDPGKRAVHLAELIPLDFELARRVLVWYGGIEGVGEALAFNFDREGWVGPASVHYEEKKEKFIKLLNGEKERKVRDWLNYYIGMLDDRLSRARTEEEI